MSSDELSIPSEANSVDPSTNHRWFGTLNQPDFDVDFYERVLRGQPNDVRLLRLLGELYARTGNHARALQIDRKLAELLPDEALVHYNLACSLAMHGSPAAALESLAQAIQLGYNDFSHLEVDPDLNSLRPLPEYQAILKQFRLDG
jgi:tetratricopeptide (TPR) repeat protein